MTTKETTAGTNNSKNRTARENSKNDERAGERSPALHVLLEQMG
jgi:hypothetical protein